MATCKQQIIWHFKKSQLKSLLDQAGENYTALQFKMCIDDHGGTKYFISLVNVQTTGANLCEGAVRAVGQELQACPVPPDCTKNPTLFKAVLEKYYGKDEISFSIDKNHILEQFQ